ncbi:MAG: thiamine phosphate synthase [Anaerolineae bacterium]
MKTVDWSLYVITDRRAAGSRSILDIVGAAIQGGATVVQLREKEATTRQMIQLGQALHELTQRAGIPLIINDRVDVALAIDAEGVHLGVDDMPVPIARRLLGPHRLIGFSPSTLDEACQAEDEGADYLGIGDVYGTPSKPDAGAPIGIEGLSRFVQTVSIPVVAIGGINASNAAATIEAGAAGIAVISAVIGAPDPQKAAQQLRAIVKGKQGGIHE